MARFLAWRSSLFMVDELVSRLRPRSRGGNSSRLDANDLYSVLSHGFNLPATKVIRANAIITDSQIVQTDVNYKIIRQFISSS